MSEQIPAAWYPDPDDNGESERWWDGNDWTDHTRQPPPVQVPPPRPTPAPPVGPPHPGPVFGFPPQMPFAPPRPQKRGVPAWVWVVGVILVLAVAGSAIGSNSSNSSTASAPSPAPADSTAPTPDTTANSAPAAAAPPAAPVTLLDITGTGAQTTAKFTTGTNDWDLAYTYDCSNFGTTGNFIADVYTADGSPSLDNSGANEIGSGGLRVQHYHTGGTFYLMINSECSWHVKASTAS